MKKLSLWLICIVVFFVFICSQRQTTNARESLTYTEIAQLGRGTITSAAWRPDGQAIAIAGSAGIWLYTPNFDDIAHIEGYLLGDVAWSPDGTRIAASGYGSTTTEYYDGSGSQYASAGSIMIWDAETFEAVELISQSEAEGAESVTWNSDGTKLASVRIGVGVSVWDAASGNKVFESITEPGVSPIYFAEWSPNGQMLAGITTEYIVVLDMRTGTELIRFRTDEPFSQLAWDSDNRIFYAVRDNDLKRFDLFQEESPTGSSNERPVITYAMAMHPDGHLIATGTWDGDIYISDWVLSNDTVVLRGHTGKITDVAWSPDGSQLLSISEDGTARIWNSDGVNIATLTKHFSPVATVDAVSWSPDGSQLVSVHQDYTLRVWDRVSGEVLHTIAPPQEIATNRIYSPSVAWSPDGTQIASTDSMVRIWNAADGSLIKSLPGQLFVSWSPDGTKLITRADDGGISILDVDSGRIADHLPQETRAYTASWSGDGLRIVYANNPVEDEMAMVRVYNLIEHKLEHTFQGLPSATWRADRTQLATTNGAWLHIRDLDSELPVLSIPSNAHILAWHPSGTRIAANQFNTPTDSPIMIWDTTSGELLSVIPDAYSFVFGRRNPNGRLIWSNDGQYLAGVGYDGIIRIWQEHGTAQISVPPTPTPPSTYHPPQFSPSVRQRARPFEVAPRFEVVNYLQLGQRTSNSTLSANAQFLASKVLLDSTRASFVQLINVGTQQHINAIQADRWQWSPVCSTIAAFRDYMPGVQIVALGGEIAPFTIPTNNQVDTVAWHPFGEVIAVAAEVTIDLWNVQTGSRIHQFSGLRGRVSSMVWSPEGCRLASYSRDFTVHVWNVCDPSQPVLVLHNATGVPKWSNSGKYLAVSSDLAHIRVWDTYSGSLYSTISGHTSKVDSVNWSDDDQLIVSLSSSRVEQGTRVQGTAIVWDVEGSRQLHEPITVADYVPVTVPLSTQQFLLRGYRSVYLLDAQSGQTTRIMDDNRSDVFTPTLAVHPRLPLIASALEENIPPNRVLIRDALTGELLVSLNGLTGNVDHVLWSSDGAFLLATSSQGEAVVWKTTFDLF
jgi:WD40 repeat protein